LSEVKTPLCVDLDGTLIRTDVMFESIVILLRDNPLNFFFIIFWLIKGRYYLKEKLIEKTKLDPNKIPINEEIIEYLKVEQKNGRKILLVTAAMQEIANLYADYFGIFDEAVGSKDGINLVGKNKASYLVNRFGEGGFDYIGDSKKDLYIWKHSRNSYIVNQTKNIIDKVKKDSNVLKIWNLIPEKKITLFFKQIRAYQWVKNLLIFLPIILSHSLNLQDYILSFLAFVSFSFLSSSIYLINDIYDLDSDRIHPEKKYRPFASGHLNLLFVLTTSIILFLLSFVIALFINLSFLFSLFIYLIFSLLYTYSFKKIPILDIVILSFLFTIRIYAGSFATNIAISEWLFSFSIFFFLSLSSLKRYIELIKMNDNYILSGRAYTKEDRNFIKNIGVSTGLISILVYVLYINSSKVYSLYSNPEYLYFILLILIYWLLRLWFYSDKKILIYDPIIYILKDKVSYILLLLSIILFLFAL